MLLGGDRRPGPGLRHAGYRVDRHALDTGPAGVPPPRVRSPSARRLSPGRFRTPRPDAVVLLDELALTVLEEEALTEAARVLRPGGTSSCAFRPAGRLAWLDGYNAYRYLRDITDRGGYLPESRGLAGGGTIAVTTRQLLRPTFSPGRCVPPGLDCPTASVWLSVFWRWALRSGRGDTAIAPSPPALARFEGRLAPADRGYWLVAAAERGPPA